MSSLHSLLWAPVLSWPSAEPSRFANLVEHCQKHFLLGYQVLRLTTCFKVSVPVPSSPVCLIQQLPSLQQGILQLLWLQLPGCSFDGSANLSGPTLWFPPYAAASQSWLNCLWSHRATRMKGWIQQMAQTHLTATLGRWQGQCAGRKE